MTPNRYSRSAIILHWAIAIGLAFQLALGWRLEDIPKGPGQFAAYQLHKSVGITILVLTLVRLAIRLARPRPLPLADSPWAMLAARAVHWLFYAVLLVGPLTGWIIVSTARIKVPTLIFGAVPWPHLPVPQMWHPAAKGAHGVLAWVALGLFILHVAGALRHQFVKDENILGRMVPFLTAGPVSKTRGAAAAGLALFMLWAVHGAGWQMPFSSGAEPRIAPVAVQPSPPAAPQPDLAIKPDLPTLKQTETQPIADWTVLPGGHLGFAANWSGNSVKGQFKRWSSVIRFSPDMPEKTAIRVTVDLASVDTDDGQRDDSLKSPDFFDTATHPQAIFTATGLRSLGPDRYEARGLLDLHGKSHPVTLAFTMRIKGDGAHVSGTTRIDRTVFGVGSGEWAATDQIAANVAVSFAFSAKRKNAN